MDVLVIVLANLLLLFFAPAAKRLLEVAIGILAADHESNLAGRIGRNGGVGVFDVREDLFAICLELGYQRQVKPLVFG